MALDFAAAQNRMAVSVIRRLANARLVPTGGVAVEGIFGRLPTDAPAGSSGYQSQNPTFRAVLADLPTPFGRDTQVRVYWDDQLVQLAGQYVIRHRDDDPLQGTSVLDLQLDA